MQAFYPEVTRNRLYIFYMISMIEAKMDTWLKVFCKVSVVPSSLNYCNFIHELCYSLKGNVTNLTFKGTTTMYLKRVT